MRFEFDEARAAVLASERDTGVIVTNIPFATEDRDIVRHGATAATILRLYLDRYKVEHTYRLMKSGMGVDSVYVPHAGACGRAPVRGRDSDTGVRHHRCPSPEERDVSVPDGEEGGRGNPARVLRVPSRYRRHHGHRTRRVR